MSYTGRLVLALLGVVLVALPARPTERQTALSDQEFWRLVVTASEPDGYFRSDNLTSNELLFQRVIPDLVRRTRRGGAYLGVGPEQNFTYIAAVRPAIAIILDIRRGNLLLQLMYKALFEIARDRAEFVSMLFSKPRPPDVGVRSTAAELFAAFASVPADEPLFKRNLRTIEDRLTGLHRLALSAEDLNGLEQVFRAFYSRGFAVRFSPTYAELMTQTDSDGVARSYLAAEASFAAVKDLESRNLVIPVVGDFGGPKALRAIGNYLKGRGTKVTTFYLSNVEQYLYQDGKWPAFCRSVGTLPLDASSTFVRASGGRGVRFGVGFVTSLRPILEEVKSCE
jgi:hypothetical protein